MLASIIAHLALLLRTSPALEPDIPLSQPIDTARLLASLSGEAEDEDQRTLYGHQFPNLVSVEDLAIIVHAAGLDAIRDRYEGPGTITVSGALTSPFDSPVRDVEMKIAFFRADETERTWHRVTASPLTLTDEELQKRLPRPSFTIEKNLLAEPDATVRGAVDVRVQTEVDHLELSPRALPGYLTTLTHYTLDEPTAEDVAQIVERGGTTDLMALTQWADQLGEDSTPFEPIERSALMRTIGERLRTLRAPPGLGDLQRINAMLLLVRTLADDSDLEFLLRLDRAMRIMLTSAALSYFDALLEENFVELPIHGAQHLPSSSRELMQAYRYALENVRRKSLARLLELTYDPLDYRDAPDGAVEPSVVQAQAKALLRPLDPTNVADMLDAAAHDVAAQREILRYYVRVQHAPVVEPLLRWLLLHPDEYAGLGVFAARELGSRIVPALLRHYFEPSSREHKALARKLLLQLDTEPSNEVVQIIRSTGVAVADEATLEQALAKFDEKQAGQLRRDASELEEEVFEGDNDVISLSARLQAIQRLSAIDPQRLRRRSDEVMDLLTTIALALDTDSPAESARALHLLETLPLDAGSTTQAQALAIARARLAISRREFDRGLKLLEADEVGDNEAQVRELYLGAVMKRASALIDGGDFGRASQLLERAEARYSDAPELIELRDRLFVAQYWPALALGGLFSLTLLSTLAWVVVRGVGSLVARRASKRKRAERSAARDEQARRSAEEPDRVDEVESDDTPPAPAEGEAIDSDSPASPADREASEVRDAEHGDAMRVHQAESESGGKPDESHSAGGAEEPDDDATREDSIDDDNTGDSTEAVEPDADDSVASRTIAAEDDDLAVRTISSNEQLADPETPDDDIAEPTIPSDDPIYDDDTVADRTIASEDDDIPVRAISTEDEDIADRTITSDDEGLANRTITSDDDDIADDRTVPDDDIVDRTISTEDDGLAGRTITSDDDPDDDTVADSTIIADDSDDRTSDDGDITDRTITSDDDDVAARTITSDDDDGDVTDRTFTSDDDGDITDRT
ncbi:MAG: hypothetical protein B7733_23430, partial [Myxococcales bacterium FL481]